MTGRRLYEIVTDALRAEAATDRVVYADGREGNVIVGNFENHTPPAFSYLIRNERDAWNAAAKRISAGRRKS